MDLDLKEEILFAISRYDYAYAYKLAQKLMGSSSIVTSLLAILAERRELNILSAMDEELKTALQTQSGFQLFCHTDLADEQLANYLYDLEAKLRNEQIIDFVRAVSPAIYRIFMRLIKLEILVKPAMTVGSLNGCGSRIMLPYRSFMQKARSIHPV